MLLSTFQKLLHPVDLFTVVQLQRAPFTMLKALHMKSTPASSVEGSRINSVIEEVHILLAYAPPLSVCVGQSWRGIDLVAFQNLLHFQEDESKTKQLFFMPEALNFLAEKARQS